MKPSERIKEIRKSGVTEINLDGPGLIYTMSKIDAVIKYLDEQHEAREKEAIRSAQVPAQIENMKEEVTILQAETHNYEFGVIFYKVGDKYYCATDWQGGEMKFELKFIPK